LPAVKAIVSANRVSKKSAFFSKEKCALKQINLLSIAAFKVSAFRSYSYQEDLFQRYSDSHGPDEANRFGARPGQSEHQLGTTIDFGGTAFDLTAAFAETDQGLWLANNAHLFGLVMIYPEGGEDVIGYLDEPWYYRYIGVEEALNFKRSGLTLTEYLNRKYDWHY